MVSNVLFDFKCITQKVYWLEPGRCSLFQTTWWEKKEIIWTYLWTIKKGHGKMNLMVFRRFNQIFFYVPPEPWGNDPYHLKAGRQGHQTPSLRRPPNLEEAHFSQVVPWAIGFGCWGQGGEFCWFSSGTPSFVGETSWCFFVCYISRLKLSKKFEGLKGKIDKSKERSKKSRIHARCTGPFEPVIYRPCHIMSSVEGGVSK